MKRRQSIWFKQINDSKKKKLWQNDEFKRNNNTNTEKSGINDWPPVVAMETMDKNKTKQKTK